MMVAVQFIFVGDDAGVPISTFVVVPSARRLLVANENTEFVVEAFKKLR